MTLPGRSRLTLEERSIVDAALDEAFASLRARTARSSPARARAAARWSGATRTPLRGLALLQRASELSVAAAISALLFGGTLASVAWVPEQPEQPDLSRDAVRAGQWELNGRIALQRPMDSRATDYRTIAGDQAANAAIIHRDAARADRMPEQISSEQ